MQIRELTNEQFKQFSSVYPMSSIYQTIEYALVMSHQNYQSLLLGYIDDANNLIAASLVLIERLNGFKYAYAPRGFLIDYQNEELVKNFTIALKQYLGKKDVIAIKISPMIPRNIYDEKTKMTYQNNQYDRIYEILSKYGYFHMGYNLYFEAHKPRFEAVIDMNKPYFQIFQHFKKQVRTKIRSAAKKGVQIYKGNESNLEYLYLQAKDKYPRDLKYYQDCFEYMEKKKMVEFFYAKVNTEQYLKTVKKQYEYYEAKVWQINQLIQKADAKKKSRLLNKKMKLDLEFASCQKNLVSATNLLAEFPDGIITASIMVSLHKDEVRILADGYDTRFKSFHSKNFLIWQLIERYSKLGYKKFNLGGMAAMNIKDNPYQGLNQFKLSFNPQVYEYIGDLELITNRMLYRLYRNMAPIRNILKK